jgi:copper(I)-binding protein
MKNAIRPALVAAFTLALAAPALAHEGMIHDGCPTGQEFTAGDITVTGAFTRATLPDARVGAGYFTISNAGGEADRLIAASSEVSPTVELHNMIVDNGMMKMSQVEGGIEVPAGGSVSLAPGGLHVMFIGPNQPFNEGECVEVTLSFEKAGEVPVQLVVGPVGADGAPGHEGH